MLDRFKVPLADQVHVSEAVLRQTVAAIFEKCNLTPEDAAIGADVLVTTDLRGVESHGVSNMLRWQMAYLEIPATIETALLDATQMPWLMLLYINIIQIVLGIFLDMAAHILITTPLFLPLAIQMGVGPVQFGMMLLLNCALGLVHPPVGTVQFVGCAIANISIGQATRTAWPYYLAIFVAINLVTYVPGFSTWLPSLIAGHPVL